MNSGDWKRGQVLAWNESTGQFETGGFVDLGPDPDEPTAKITRLTYPMDLETSTVRIPKRPTSVILRIRVSHWARLVDWLRRGWRALCGG